MANKSNRDTNVKIGRMLQSARESQKVTQAEMATAIDISKHHVSALECGDSKASIEVLLGYCKKLGLTPNDILGFKDGEIIPNLKNKLASMPKDEQKKILEMTEIMSK